MELVSPARAIRAIPDGSCVVLPQGAIEPSCLYEAFTAEHARFRSLSLYSGLQFGAYSFLASGLGTHFSYTTWQTALQLRELMRAGRIRFLPLRFSEICSNFSPGGACPPDVVVVQVAPARNDRVSLGIAVSIFPELIANARLVIAEINPAMPYTEGAALIPTSAIDIAIESDRPLGTYAPRARTVQDSAIAGHVLSIVPEGAWVQLGVGAIPDAVLERLSEIARVNLHSGMLTDGLIAYMDRARHTARVVTGELAGTPDLYAFASRTPAIELHPTSTTHSPFVAGRLPRFVAINSAIEIDLSGQVNGEAIDGVQVSGVGGSLDFVQAAAYSPGGMAVIALPSTTRNGSRSRIVPALAAGAPVTLPRVAVDVVVTEFGVAHLRGRDIEARAEALVAIAHPDFRDALANRTYHATPTGP